MKFISKFQSENCFTSKFDGWKPYYLHDNTTGVLIVLKLFSKSGDGKNMTKIQKVLNDRKIKEEADHTSTARQ